MGERKYEKHSKNKHTLLLLGGGGGEFPPIKALKKNTDQLLCNLWEPKRSHASRTGTPLLKICHCVPYCCSTVLGNTMQVKMRCSRILSALLDLTKACTKSSCCVDPVIVIMLVC